MKQKKEKRTWWALPNKTVSFATNTYYDAYSVVQQIPKQAPIMDRWTLGIFLHYFLDQFLDHFLDHFIGGGGTISTLGGVRCSLSVLREGWEADCCYSGRGGRRTISTQGGMGGGYRSKCNWLMEFLLDHTNFLGGFSTEYFLCQTFWAGLLRWTFLLSCECESATQTLDFNCNWKYGQFPFLILQCWVMRVFVKSTCSSVKWNLLVITNHLSVASRFPLCGQYIITKFIHLPFVIDFIRRQSSRNFRSLALT